MGGLFSYINEMALTPEELEPKKHLRPRRGRPWAEKGAEWLEEKMEELFAWNDSKPKFFWLNGQWYCQNPGGEIGACDPWEPDNAEGV